MTTKELIYSELRRLAETNYSDPITIEHCIRCGTFLLDVIFSKFIENEYFITNGKYNKHDAWARKFAHIRSSEFKRYDVVKRDPISKKRKLIVSGKSFVDMFVENGLVFRNDRYSNFLTKSFSKSYTLGSEYLNDLIQEQSNSDPQIVEIRSLVDCYYDELAPFWYCSFHDFWKYRISHELTEAETRLYEMSKERMPNEMCSYTMKLADIWGFDISKPKCLSVVDGNEYPF